MKTIVWIGALTAFFSICNGAAASGTQADPAATEVWNPEPALVAPGDSRTAPSDAIVLFSGNDLKEWTGANGQDSPAGWRVFDGVMKVVSGAGHIQTRRLFRDYQLHLEWRTPSDALGTGQHRGNSGVFLAATGPGPGPRGYEVQILDCFHNRTYANGQASSVYKQFIPLVNACRPNGEWQSYDVLWSAPRFRADHSLLSPARLTVLHNGILVQWNVELGGETVYAGTPRYAAHGPAPILLQDHGDKGAGVEFRNIWVRELNRVEPGSPAQDSSKATQPKSAE
ncbi:3-keto-disaccharide hydrolase [Pseudoduganella namucuonensis]|uniref:3-keto-alpha-glucoside-1,2-lyase/3-keto-2-hydroxy-glucal hydratase domain-containing protein n=1 Tax=Pseudoduganella namucuonensis TaxID=1035707 RepID=A0A1I7G7A1_9BURK|nr:DUF1080 domain-containing protein [Pseudoduganella namucuonensis]SFU44231.1 protein of unknown function [Pseudoduganella namucuonensis]